MIVDRLGSWAAGAVAVIGLAYVAALIVGFGQVGFDAPIGDPILAILESLTLLSALAVVIAMAGTAGPLVGDMRLQRIGILGYAGVLPFAFFFLARFFRDQQVAAADAAFNGPVAGDGGRGIIP
jgi:hypothetical protein